VESFFESLNEQLSEHIEKGAGDKHLPVAALFAHIQENEKIISGIFMSESGTVLFDRFKSYWSARIRPIIEAHSPAGQNSKIPVDMLTNHVISTIIELTQFWLQGGLKYTPEQMEQYYFELIYPVLAAASS
ncbi:MAG: TetR family transcriptional regulator C-terminal domain-containing protein, partial [Oscillospiraceae bacterium]|nr:TetR family transcriptional regulator C-terminal domain-containing protein [Oscillospiraceae bacterium]